MQNLKNLDKEFLFQSFYAIPFYNKFLQFIYHRDRNEYIGMYKKNSRIEFLNKSFAIKEILYLH